MEAEALLETEQGLVGFRGSRTVDTLLQLLETGLFILISAEYLILRLDYNFFYQL